MSVRLALARLFVPGALKRRKLSQLARLTAHAFAAELPLLDGLPWRRRLLEYGRFTREAAERALDTGGDATELERRLFEGARVLGEDLARDLGVASPSDAMKAARILYRCLGIDLRVDRDGGIIVRRCFFARLYTPAVCRLISALDAGVLAGLTGGGTLRFEQRLTEGAACCRARFVRQGAA